MKSKLAPPICLAVVFSGSLTLSAQSVEAKASHNSTRIPKNYFVPPPPPYTPSMVPAAQLMIDAQAGAVGANGAVIEYPVNSGSKYIVTRIQDNVSKVAQSNPYASVDPVAERKIQKRIDSIDSEISGVQEKIGKLLNL